MKIYFTRIFILFISLFIIGNTAAQNKTISGYVIDESTKNFLAFVNILSQDGKYGTSTDIDGEFQFTIPDSVEHLILSYVGYESMEVDLNSETRYLFKMKKKAYLLSELEITPGINPAHRIIRNVIQNRDLNDPKKLESYSYTSYDKMVITLDLEVTGLSDSVIMLPDSIKSIGQFVKDKDILLMENVVEKKFLAPERNHEKIIASKVSGLQDPLMTFVVSQIQSTSFYEEIIHMVNNHYINPISKGSFAKYYFQMEDTSYSVTGDSIFSISYTPLPNKNFDGLEGVISISSHQWAIVNVRATPTESNAQGFHIEIQQLYEYLDGHWFPIQLNTNILFDNMIATSSGEKAKFIGIGKSYHKDIVLNPELVRRQFSHIEVELDPNAGFQKDEFWDEHRSDSLSERDKRTYTFMDSVGQAENFDGRLKKMESLMTGNIPWGKLELPLDKIVGYNNYEGLWLGAGLRTNKRMSTKWGIGAYGAYSFRAQKAKYGIDGQMMLYQPLSLKIGGAYSRDFEEAAGVEYFNSHQNAFDPELFKSYFISRANYTDRKELYFQLRAFQYVEASIGGRVDHKEASYDYYYQTDDMDIGLTEFDFTEIKVGLRFAYKEKFFDNNRMLISMGTNYPILWLNYSKGLKGVLGGGYDFHRLDARIKKSFYLKYFGESTIDMNGGVILGELPYSNLYRGQGTYGPITTYAPASFGSMSANEFLSDRYVSAYLTHDFGNLLLKGKKFKPELVLVTNIGFGWLSNHDSHHNISYKTMERGYFESGFFVNKILNLYMTYMGLGFTYRYGAYSHRLFEDNLSIKFTWTFPVEDSFVPVE